MNISMGILQIIALILLSLICLVICVLLINRLNKRQKHRQRMNRNHDVLHSDLIEERGTGRRSVTSSYLQLKQSVHLDTRTRERLEKNLDIDRAEDYHIEHLRSFSRIRRIESAASLGLIGTQRASLYLENSLSSERDNVVRLYIANALADIGSKDSIPVLVESLMYSNHFYREKVNVMLAGFGKAFDSYLPEIIDSKAIEMKELIVEFASRYFSEQSKAYLLNLVRNRKADTEEIYELYGRFKDDACAKCINSSRLPDGIILCDYKGRVDDSDLCKRYKQIPVSIDIERNYRKLVIKACEVLASYFPKELDSDEYLDSDDIQIKNIAVRSLSAKGSPHMITRLTEFLKNGETARSAVYAISRIIENHPGYINLVAQAFTGTDDTEVRQGLASVLSGKIEYYIMKLSTKSKEDARQIILEILVSGRNSEVIDFMNKNNDINIENELVALVKAAVRDRPDYEANFSKYLKPRISAKCGFAYTEKPAAPREQKRDRKLVVSLCVLLAISVLLFPAIYCLRRWDILRDTPFIEQLKIFILDFNYFIAFYSMAISLIYLGLLALSFINAKNQIRLWRAKNMSLLFKKGVMPSVSIIAPAYNEEKTIIESANSLLNLKYPDYELIIVNDGSKDNTLDVLMRYFDLTRVDYIVETKLSTKPIRGVYVNRQMPKLIVVDKENGGKADSLNSGINIANKEYFCGIDADSLLEDEALLKLPSLTLDTGIETPALGGNIFPINGCTIEQGQIKDIRIPKNSLARFQTVEYTRAFMSGRLGWAFLNSLLIISGAFGLFRKERIINIGGYLTSSGRYSKDTVGEDMELVVRISRFMKELKQSFRIGYSFAANCWTEVPEDLKSLKKQRYRWHRGLIEILSFHKKMLFNPRYGKIGMIAVPYYFIFELMGPLFEIQAYVMVLLALLFGVMNQELALLLFVTTILLGALISVSSLAIEESDAGRFVLKDLLVLILYSLLENFGPRQLISFWRVSGFLNMLKKPGGWDKAVRKGFESKAAAPKGQQP